MKQWGSKQKTKCPPGWPHETGYPICETTPSQANVTNPPVTPNIYSYCCPPSPVLMAEVSGIQKRSNYRNNVPRPRGVHSYYNVMWDGRVRRGDPAKKSSKRNEEECEKIRARLNEPRKTKTYSELKAEAKAAAATQESSIVQSELLRFSQLAISNLCPKDPEKYLLELHDELDTDDPCYKGRRLQVLRNFPIAPARKPNLKDTGTQILPGEFFDFDFEAQPVIEKTIGSIVEQARLEILEEEEQAAHLLQMVQYKVRRAKEEKILEKLRHRDVIVKGENERLQQTDTESRTGLTQIQKMHRACAAAGNLTKKALDECVENFKKEVEIKDQHLLLIQDGIIPWLNIEVVERVKQDHASRSFLDELIIDVVSKREAEFAEAIWRDVYEVDPSRKYANHDGFVPPTPETSLAEGQTEEDLGTSDYFNEESDEF